MRIRVATKERDGSTTGVIEIVIVLVAEPATASRRRKDARQIYGELSMALPEGTMKELKKLART